MKFRGQTKHRYFNVDAFDIEQEIYRKNNWERIFGRVKESFAKEKSLLQERLKIEAQIRKVEHDDLNKLKIVGKLTNI